ncbi:hypothetical protein B0H14DRAFT_3530020 [Mycena olivaceomarginata]|nr:hypothetical protein B0H14DRAFT_3530020 [Mycena olivaceomarginata]
MVPIPAHRFAITRLLLSDHNLAVERLRYPAPSSFGFESKLTSVQQTIISAVPHATAGLLAGIVLRVFFYIYIFNKRRDKKFGPPDVAAAKETGM